jgi:hypothetical protein
MKKQHAIHNEEACHFLLTSKKFNDWVVNLPKCSSYYRWLHDACMNARYNNYQVSDEKAINASKYLSELKSHLNK